MNRLIGKLPIQTIMARLVLLSDLRKVASQAGVIVLARVAGSLLTLVYTIMLTELLSPNELGIVFAAVSFSFLLSIAMSFNVESGSIRYLQLYLGEGRKADAAGFIVFGHRIILCCAVAALFLSLSFYFGWNGVAGPTYAVAALVAPVTAITRLNARHATALDRVLQGALPRLLVRPLLFVLVIAACLRFGYRPSAVEVMALFLIAACLSALLQWVLMRPVMQFRLGVVPRFSERADWLKMGAMLVPMLLLNEYLRDVMIMATNAVLTPANLAVFTIAISLVGPLGFITSAVDSAFSPRIARAVLQNQPEQQATLLTAAGLIKFGGLSVGALMAYPLIPLVLDYMGAAYYEARALFLILILMPIIVALLGPGALIFNILGRRRDLLGLTGFGVATYVGSLVIGGWIAGVTGVCVGCVLATLVYHFVLATACYRRTGIDCSVLSVRTWKARHSASG